LTTYSLNTVIVRVDNNTLKNIGSTSMAKSISINKSMDKSITGVYGSTRRQTVSPSLLPAIRILHY